MEERAGDSLPHLIPNLAFAGQDIGGDIDVQRRTADFNFTHFEAGSVNIKPSLRGWHGAEGKREDDKTASGID